MTAARRLVMLWWDGPPAMPYPRVQFIGYTLDTFPVVRQGPALVTRHPANNRNEVYLGHPNDDVDLAARVDLMSDAIRAASQSAHVSGNANVLKIFMAPEFFFRGKNGAYPVEKVATIAEQLRRVVGNIRYQHWLFVCGSAIGRFDRGGDTEIFNIAIAQLGGTTRVDATTSVLVYKEFISPIDFIRDTNTPWVGPIGGYNAAFAHGTTAAPTRLTATEGARAPAPGPVTVGANENPGATGLGGQSRFTMAQADFGLEVCLDHAKNRLYSATPFPGVQIHLIPSAGMQIDANRIAAKGQGFVFNVDAQWIELVQNMGTYAVPVLNPIAAVDIIDMDTAPTRFFNGNIDTYFGAGKGDVAVYPVQQMPP